MRRMITAVLSVALLILAIGCREETGIESNLNSRNAKIPSADIFSSRVIEGERSEYSFTSKQADAFEEDVHDSNATSAVESIIQSDEDLERSSMKHSKFYITVGDRIFEARFADNVAATALCELLSDSAISLSLEDYGGFEKVGTLPRSLSSANRRISTQSGDIVLYQGNQIVLFYGSNTWSYTKLGTVVDLTGWDAALRGGDISVTLSLQR